MAIMEFKVLRTKRTEVAPGTEILNIDLAVSYAEFLSITKHLEKPFRAKFELPDGSEFEHRVGFGKGGDGSANAKITMRNHDGELPEGSLVTLLENE